MMIFILILFILICFSFLFFGWGWRLQCPGFKKHFPKENIPGPWVAIALSETVFSKPRERVRYLVNGGLQDAYVTARYIAFLLDCKLPYDADGEIGVRWAIRRPQKGDIYDKII